MLLHEALVGPPGHTGRLHGIPLRPQGNLMSVKIVQSEFIQRRFLNDLMDKQKWFDAHRFREPSKAPGQVAVDEDGTSVAAITRDVRDIVVAIDADAVADGARHYQTHVVFHIFRLMSRRLFLSKSGLTCTPQLARS